MISTITTLLSLLFGILGGYKLNIYISNRVLLKNEALEKEAAEVIYRDIYTNILHSKFTSRIMQTVYISMSLDIGDVDVIYLIEKGDIVVSKNGVIIHTSYLVDVLLIDAIITNIMSLHGESINDIVSVSNMILSKSDFARIFNMTYEEFVIFSESLHPPAEESDIERIINDNAESHDVDEILDKIKEKGVDGITKDEMIFLEEYSKKT